MLPVTRRRDSGVHCRRRASQPATSPTRRTRSLRASFSLHPDPASFPSRGEGTGHAGTVALSSSFLRLFFGSVSPREEELGAVLKLDRKGERLVGKKGCSQASLRCGKAKGGMRNSGRLVRPSTTAGGTLPQLLRKLPGGDVSREGWETGGKEREKERERKKGPAHLRALLLRNLGGTLLVARSSRTLINPQRGNAEKKKEELENVTVEGELRRRNRGDNCEHES